VSVRYEWVPVGYGEYEDIIGGRMCEWVLG